MNTICFNVTDITAYDTRNKVQAIGALRQLVGISLKDAKDTFEQSGKTFTFTLRSTKITDQDSNISILNSLTDNFVFRESFVAVTERTLRDLAVRGLEAGEYNTVRRLLEVVESLTPNT